MQRIFISETVQQVGQEVLVKGWVHSRRDHGKIIFIDLRDKTGLLQVVFTPEQAAAHQLASQLRPEFVISIKGKVKNRPEKLINDKMLTGTVEMEALELEILNEAQTPPFEIDKDTSKVSEEIRLKYRYLDLRSERMNNNMVMRSRVVKFFRDYLETKNFLEIETPILTKGTPEGAREFIVPARLWPGMFYVLPQSPQQFKQLLMVAGAERYFQIARCFRDEDQRGDRQAEFTQLDMEMSFIEPEDILQLVEGMMIEMIQKLYPQKKIQQIPFPRLSYAEAMEKYNSDKPDLRKDKNDPSELAFCWVVDMPMFKQSVSEKKLVASHHPFTMPNKEDMDKYPDEPLKWRAYAYDLALNGFEIGGGSIRIHRREIQQKIFELLNLKEEEIKRRFGHMLAAFEYGAPPHGGIAPGIDRIMAILQNEPNIREVIVFPKTGDNKDLMMDAPNLIGQKALDETHIKLADDVEIKEAEFDTSVAD
ncbi:MAG: aspartate--tRNA ligase [Candidatus Buchananbacteria bacterium]|nr:aspartate--tRNA ligase [Candidatus Buchananbacteria bacterium]